MNKIAIVVVAYNRVDSLLRLLLSLEKAWYGEDKPTLIISIDKSNTDVVEEFADQYKWPFGKKIVKKHLQNLGLRNHMMSLGTWFDLFDSLVILEDDIVVSPAFYNYVKQATDKYVNHDDIAGISLYSFSTNYITGLPFSPLVNQYDGYFMNCAMSWGEVWMKKQWASFYSWYLEHQEFNDEPFLPRCLYKWSKSWLKYHTRYCIEYNKYFLYPYISLSTNFSDPGTHNKGSQYTTYQLPLLQGIKNYTFPDDVSFAVCYDGFFENKHLYEVLGVSESECTIDLHGSKGNRMKRKYWLTTQIADFPIIKSFGLAYKPLEQNIFNSVDGFDIFLYDTNCREVKSKLNQNVLLYSYNIGDLLEFIRMLGIKYILNALISKIFSKL